MCRLTTPFTAEELQEFQSDYLTAEDSSEFFAQHAGPQIQIHAPIAGEFDILAEHRHWKPNSRSGIYEEKWEACFGPNVPVGDYQAIDNRCPFVFLDHYWGTHWEPECGVGFDDYFYRLAAEVGWKKGAKSGKFEKNWRKCFGPNFPVGMPPAVPAVSTCDCKAEEEQCRRFLPDEDVYGRADDANDDSMGAFWRDMKHHRKANPPILETMPVAPARDALAFFNKYPRFDVQEGEWAVSEFERLAGKYRWQRGANSHKYERAWNECLDALRGR